MKTKLALVILLVLNLTALGDVLVWSGSGPFQKGDATSNTNLARLVVVITDPATASTGIVIATPSKRLVTSLGPFNTGFIEVGPVRTRTQFFTCGNAAFTSAGAYGFFQMRLKGIRSTMALRPGNVNVVNFPRVISGIWSDMGGTLEVTGTFTLRFDQRRTFDNNGANRTVLGAMNDVIAKFTGYTPGF